MTPQGFSLEESAIYFVLLLFIFVFRSFFTNRRGISSSDSRQSKRSKKTFREIPKRALPKLPALESVRSFSLETKKPKTEIASRKLPLDFSRKAPDRSYRISRGEVAFRRLYRLSDAVIYSEILGRPKALRYDE